MEEFNLNFNTIITIIGFIITAAGLYWKVRIDLTKLDLKIEEIQCDRQTRWAKNDEKADKTEAYLSDISRGINEVKVAIEGIKKDVEWLKKDK